MNEIDTYTSFQALGNYLKAEIQASPGIFKKTFVEMVAGMNVLKTVEEPCNVVKVTVKFILVEYPRDAAW